MSPQAAGAPDAGVPPAVAAAAAAQAEREQSLREQRAYDRAAMLAEQQAATQRIVDSAWQSLE